MAQWSGADPLNSAPISQPQRGCVRAGINPRRIFRLEILDRGGKEGGLARFRADKIAINQGFFDPPLFKNGFAVVRRATVDDKSDIRIMVITRKGEILWKGEGQH